MIIEDEGSNLSVGQVDHSISLCIPFCWLLFLYSGLLYLWRALCTRQEHQNHHYGRSYRSGYFNQLICLHLLNFFVKPRLIMKRIIRYKKLSLMSLVTALSFALLVRLSCLLFNYSKPSPDRLRTIISYDRICVLDAGQIAVRTLHIYFLWLTPPNRKSICPLTIPAAFSEECASVRA